MLKNEIIKTYGNKIRNRVCGILIEDNKILLVKQQLHKEDKFFWSPPGGGLEFGETLEECLEREFLEETNLEIEIKDFHSFTEHIEHPLHAIEFFYTVIKKAGICKKGIDPELDKNSQSIKECLFLELEKIENDKKNTFHPILFQLNSKK